MNIQKLLSFMESFHKGDTPTVSQIEALKTQIANCNIPLDYISFISLFDGAEGVIGSDRYLAIWNLEDVLEVNKQYEDDIVFNKYLIFGSSGGTFHYAFKKDTGAIYELDLYEDSYSKFLGITLTEFVEKFSV